MQNKPAQTPQDQSQSGLAALEAALKLSQETHLVTPKENEAKVKKSLKDAKKLLKQLRGDDAPDDENLDDAEHDLNVGFNKPEPRLLVINANISPDEQRQIDLATEQFKQSVKRVDNQILAQYVQAVQNGDYAEAEAILQNAVESQQTNTLFFALLTIGVILLPLYAKQRLQKLYTQFGMNTVFSQTKSGQDAMRQQAQKGAESHVRTIAKDIKNSLDDAINDELKNPQIEASLKDEFSELSPLDQKEYLKAVHNDENIYKYARDLILSGESRQTVIVKLQENFAAVGKRRADVIAGNEANRVFTMSQFDADSQFLAQNKLTDKAYKRLVSNTGHPEAICKYIIDKTAANPIPFTQDFVPFGKTLTVTDNGKTYKFKANYEKLQSGHIHVNCHCRYELLVKQDDGTFFNTFDGKTLNEVDFEEDKHKRDKDGKFAKKASSSSIDLSKLTNKKDFDKHIEDAYWNGSLGHHSEDVTDSVRAYQGHFYDAINEHARNSQLDDALTVYGKDTTYGGVIQNINGAANVTLAEDATLYRGSDIPFHEANAVGSVLDSRSFLSTSVDKTIAEKFKYKGGSMMVISAKKGQRVILPDYVTFGKRGKTMGEAEVLTPSSSKLTITKIEGDIVYANLT